MLHRSGAIARGTRLESCIRQSQAVEALVESWLPAQPSPEGWHPELMQPELLLARYEHLRYHLADVEGWGSMWRGLGGVIRLASCLLRLPAQYGPNTQASIDATLL